VVVVAGAVAVALVALATVYAVRPFAHTLDLAKPGASAATHKALLVSGQCDAAAKTAWNHDSGDHLALWAVTVGTNMMGYTPVFGSSVKYLLIGSEEGHFPDSFCGGAGRHRLIVSAWMMLGALLVMGAGVFLVCRARRDSAGHLAT
jgi:hypothetical protein